MSNQHITIDIIDNQWPNLKVIVTRGTQVTEARAQYDIAASQFEPTVTSALRFAIDAVVATHKGGR